jgi:hypothetical protein
MSAFLYLPVITRLYALGIFLQQSPGSGEIHKHASWPRGLRPFPGVEALAEVKSCVKSVIEFGHIVPVGVPPGAWGRKRLRSRRC